jgi:hypothetical protein
MFQVLDHPWCNPGGKKFIISDIVGAVRVQYVIVVNFNPFTAVPTVSLLLPDAENSLSKFGLLMDACG